ncbi:MAG: D-aminoacyl-tRNA deacylase [Bacilli bacterium]|nr:D-aminoacyl-tRNA deacylase [Bacilli bacterium]
MRYMIQLVKSASVSIGGRLISEIGYGEVVLYGFKSQDNEKIVDKMIDKLLKLRIFPDDSGKTNCSINEVHGQLLAVSQFTLYASVCEGNRPAFNICMPSDQARHLSEYFEKRLIEKFPSAKFGIFQTDMQVQLINDGPFSLILDSEELNYEG